LRHDTRPTDTHLGLGVVEGVDERRDTKHVREEDELLADVRAHLSGLGEELEAGHPLLGREPDLLDERVHVPHERLEDKLLARVLAPRVDGEHVLGELVRAHVGQVGEVVEVDVGRAALDRVLDRLAEVGDVGDLWGPRRGSS
jgi:hypothetical protein